jgi:hypothetical protein
MSREPFRDSGSSPLRNRSRAIGRLALRIQVGFLILGVGLFLEQAQGLVSDTQFTWGERRVLGMLAALTLGGSALAGWILKQCVQVLAEVLDLLAESAEAARRTGDLLEERVVPLLSQISLLLEEQASGRAPGAPAGAPATQPEALRRDLAQAQRAGRVLRALDIRDALTQHLKGDALHTLDVQLSLWLLNLVEPRVQKGTVDAEVAGWVARALDSFGDMPEADPLRVALPALRRSAGLCLKCGRPGVAQGAYCAACRTERSSTPTPAEPKVRTTPKRERP